MYLDTKKKLNQLQSQHKLREAPLPEEFSIGLTNLDPEVNNEIRTDPLTGLPAREAVMDRLSQTLHQSRRFEKTFGVMLLDIQGLASINEQLGNEFGDKLIREVALRLKNMIRQIDTMSRYAGGMFIFLLPQLSLPETAAYVAQRLLDALVKPFRIDDKELIVHVAIGVAIFPGDGDNEQSLIKSAEEALKQAKESGENRYQFFRQELYALGQRELLMTAFFSQRNVTEHLTISYQPQINVVVNEIVNIQASPVATTEGLGTIHFREFSRISDKCNKTREIGIWVLKNAIQQFKNWSRTGFNPRNLTIPVTLKQLEQSEFINQISQVLQNLGFSPKQLILEIVDENVFANANIEEKIFSTLSQLGINIAISISTLGQFAVQRVTNLPINYLRLNSKLLERKGPQQENELILKMIIALANDMKIIVVAEEIENVQQKEIFHKLGCEIMQGTYFGEAL